MAVLGLEPGSRAGRRLRVKPCLFCDLGVRQRILWDEGRDSGLNPRLQNGKVKENGKQINALEKPCPQ